MKDILKIGKIVTKILEVCHWVGAALMAAAAVCALAAPDWVKLFVGVDVIEGHGAELNVYGFEIIAPVKNGVVDMHALFLFGIGGVLILCLMAMVFRNLYLIFSKSDGASPFQADNIRMMREIGIFSIAIPIVSLIMSLVCRLVLGVDAAEISVNMDGFAMGIIVLCLTQFFIYGAKLEKDVDGLL